jgi:hypothetical protein
MERHTFTIIPSESLDRAIHEADHSSVILQSPISTSHQLKLLGKLEQRFSLIKKKISPDFRNFLSNLQALKISDLNSAQILVERLNLLDFLSGFKYISLETFSMRNSRSDDSIVDIEDKEKIIEKLRFLIPKSSSFKISKYGLRSDIIHEKSTEELILLGKFLTVEDSSIRLNPRCVICYKKLSVMGLSGIILQCDHLICFNCHMSSNFLYCPLDHSVLKAEKYLEKNDEFFLSCHGNHCLINYFKKIYKLGCGHASCEDCLISNSFCRKCLQIINPFNVREHDFLEFILNNHLVCTKHNKKAEGILKDVFFWFCEDCECEGKAYFRDIPSYTFLDNVLNKTFQDLFALDTVKNFNFPSKFLKKCVFFKVLSLAEKAKTIRTLSFFLTQDRKFQDQTEEISLFSKTYPPLPNSSKSLQINSPVSLKIIPEQYFFLSGLKIGEMYVKSSKVIDFLEISFKLPRFEIVLNDFLVYEEICPVIVADDSSHSVHINLLRPFLMFPKKEYEIVLYLLNGHYFHGVPFSRLRHSKIFQLEGKSYSASVVLSLSLSSISFLS